MSIFQMATTFKHRVAVMVPAQSDRGVGVTTKIDFVAEYNLLPRAKSTALLEDLRSETINADEYIDAICAGVTELKRPDGSEFDPITARDELKKYDTTAGALIRAFGEAQSGDPRAKNSKR
jgi:hypothetical protein